MKTLRFIICVLLLPLTMWYALGVALRNLFFDLGWKKSVKPDVPTIGIGNLRMGGTGKTPHTEYIIRLLEGRRAALLSRGYGRETKGFVLADSHSTAGLGLRRDYGWITDGLPLAKQIGDEPMMIARKFPQLTVAVCEDRVKGVNRLMQSVQPPEVVALDDVYQHRHIMPKLNILLTEYGDPFCDDHILPFGNLRESRRGRRRADIVVVTKCPDQLTESEQQQIRRRLKISDKQQLFFSHIEYGEPVSLFGEATMDGCEDVVLVTGIAHPEPLVKYLERKYKVHHLRFSDHHSFDEADYRKIEDAYNSLGGSRKAVVTTEKDAARMMNGERLGSLQVFYIPIEVKIQNQSAFDSAVLSAAGQG